MTDRRNRILLVDDDPAVLRAYAKALETRTWTVVTAANGAAAIDEVRQGSFDVVVSDVSMPEMNGLQFLRAVREHDLDVPVILMTGAPGLESAVRAVEYGAFRYLVKPVSLQELDDAVKRAARLHAMARLKRQALEVGCIEQRRLGDRAGLEARFSMAMRLLWIAYQPIVSMGDRRIVGYEALLRCYEPTLPGPRDVIDAAERLGRVHELGRAIRDRIATETREAPAGTKVFVNIHALDFNDDELYSDAARMTHVADRIVLEVNERASLDGVRDVASRVSRLRAMGFRLAVDDLGAGYAGLASYTRLEPELAKLDMSLVRNIDAEPRKQSIVRSMKALCDELGTDVIAEGVETTAENAMLGQIGCDLQQGNFFAKADRGFPMVAF